MAEVESASPNFIDLPSFWLRRCSLDLSEYQFRLLILTCWEIWIARNKLVFESINFDLDEIEKGVANLVRELDLSIVLQKSQRAPSRRSSSRWFPPPPEKLNLNSDVSILQDGRRAWAGGIVRDDQGRFVAAIGAPIQFSPDSTTAEAMALQFVAGWVRDMGFHGVFCEVDSQRLVTKVRQSRNEGDGAEGQMLFKEVDEFVALISDSDLLHVSRDANKSAHLLASRRVDNAIDNV